MTENIVFASGYPIGFVTINNNDYYTIQLNENTYPVNLLNAFIWLEALKGGRTKIDIMDNVLEQLQSRGYEMGKDFTLENLEVGYDSLISASLLIELSVEFVELLLEEHPSIVSFRNGFGLGLDFGKIEIHHDGQGIEVSHAEYFIWQLSNGSRTLSSIYEEYEKSYKSIASAIQDTENKIKLDDLKKVFAQAFVELYKKNLIYIANI